MFDIVSLFAAVLEEPKIGMWGKGLIAYSCQSGGRGIRSHSVTVLVF